jgi:hypothetical protein
MGTTTSTVVEHGLWRIERSRSTIAFRVRHFGVASVRDLPHRPPDRHPQQVQERAGDRHADPAREQQRRKRAADAATEPL